MNLQLQALLNPARPGAAEVTRGTAGRPSGPVFRLQDRVVQVINNYEREVFNGDPGFIVDASAADRRVTVEFPETDFMRIHQGDFRPISASLEIGAFTIAAARFFL